MKHQYIFLLQEKNVRVFRLRGEDWESICRDGLEAFPYNDTEELISWWKEEAAYTDSDGQVDLLFLTDEQENCLNYELVQQKFQFNEKSVWSFKRLKDFFKQFEDMERVDLVMAANTKPRHIKDTDGRPSPGRSYKFYAFPQLKEIPDTKAGKSEESTGEGNDYAGNQKSDGTGNILFEYFNANLKGYN